VRHDRRRLTKTDAWLLARAGSAGVARAVDPTATAVDGDVVYVLAGGDATPDPLTLAAVTPHVISAAIRDAVRSATTLLGCPALGDPARGGPPAAG
jgi:L-aminopeptidase/D-esterase-like protein